MLERSITINFKQENYYIIYHSNHTNLYDICIIYSIYYLAKLMIKMTLDCKYYLYDF